MTAENQYIELKKIKYLANAEYLKSVLNEKQIDAKIDYENFYLSVKKNDFENAKIIIEKEKLDETETIDQENFMEGFEEWNKNNLNPGYYLGGNLPFFYKTKSNHMTFAILLYLSLILQIGIFFYTANVSLWNIIFAIFTLFIAVNFMISGFDYKQKLKMKKHSR